jgi:hypothetical protein
VGSIVEMVVLNNVDTSRSIAFANGFNDGQFARARSSALTPYLEVGIDDYAKGFRAGFFDQTPRVAGRRN